MRQRRLLLLWRVGITFYGHWLFYNLQKIKQYRLLISNLGSSYSPDFGVIMTAIVIGTIPTALVFFLMQKHFVAGMMGSVNKNF